MVRINKMVNQKEKKNNQQDYKNFKRNFIFNKTKTKNTLYTYIYI